MGDSLIQTQSIHSLSTTKRGLSLLHYGALISKSRKEEEERRGDRANKCHSGALSAWTLVKYASKGSSPILCGGTPLALFLYGAHSHPMQTKRRQRSNFFDPPLSIGAFAVQTLRIRSDHSTLLRRVQMHYLGRLASLKWPYPLPATQSQVVYF